MLRRHAFLLTAILLACAAAGLAGDDERPAFPRKLPVKHLPNAVQVHPRVISGGLPEGESAFAELADLGVKTIISVDGAKPDVEAARRHGLRYVHLPHGYDGIPAERAKDLAKAVRDLEGPIYLHCHHGRHRSPAAAAVACVGSGLIEPQHALDILRLAGTSENYRGLYEAAAEARRFEDRLLDELQAEFPETAVIPPLAEAMVDLEHVHDRLKQISQAGWLAPPEHPDLDPPHEALLLREHYTELLRTEDLQEQPEGFQELLRTGESAAQALEDALRAWNEAGHPEPPPEVLAETFQQVTANCTACHRRYRDIPLSEKQAD